MSDALDFNGAVDALVDANNGGPGLSEPAAPAEMSQPPAEPVESTSGSEGTTEQDSFTRIDPATLPEDLQPIYKQMQADYTRKTQSVAELRKGFEGIEDPQSAREALEFVQNLNSNPDFAVQVHQALSQSLVQAGYTPQQAQAAASQAINDQVNEMYQQGDEQYNEGYVDPLAQQVQELLQWRQEQEQRREVDEFNARVQRETMAVRQANPNLTDDDLKRIYDIAPSYDYSVSKAAEVYGDWQSAAVGQYLNRKTAVPSAPPTQQSVEGQEPAAPIQTLDQATEAALEMIRNLPQ